MENANNRIKIWLIQGYSCFYQDDYISYNTIWICNQSTIRGPIFNVYRRHVILLFFIIMRVCRINSLFNSKYLHSKSTNGMEIILILSASINNVGLNYLISFYCPLIAIFVTVLVLKY